MEKVILRKLKEMTKEGISDSTVSRLSNSILEDERAILVVADEPPEVDDDVPSPDFVQARPHKRSERAGIERRRRSRMVGFGSAAYQTKADAGGLGLVLFSTGRPQRRWNARSSS